MKKLFILTTIVVMTTSNIFGQCTSLFSFGAYFETVTFINQSTVLNAHYFWNFGDGTGSNYQNPIHRFPENGTYLVTLFAKDTISNCSSYYEYWLNLTKYSTDICQPSITDSVFTYMGTDYVKLIDLSTNCNTYYNNYDIGPSANDSYNNWVFLGDYLQTLPYRMVGREQFYDSSFVLKREAYKTSLHLYSSAKNFGDCSANFEFTVVSQDSSGQRILYKAMNKTATSYEWWITGFGGPIFSYTDTVSQFYPYTQNDIWQTGLMIHGASGCPDTMWQNILIRDSVSTTTTSGIVELQEKNNYQIYPNPFTFQTTISFAEEQKNTTIKISDIVGKEIKIINFTGRQLVIDKGEMKAGIYFVKVTDEQKNIVSKKIIIQ